MAGKKGPHSSLMPVIIDFTLSLPFTKYVSVPSSRSSSSVMLSPGCTFIADAPEDGCFLAQPLRPEPWYKSPLYARSIHKSSLLLYVAFLHGLTPIPKQMHSSPVFSSTSLNVQRARPA